MVDFKSVDKEVEVSLSEQDIENIVWLSSVKIFPEDLIIFGEIDLYGAEKIMGEKLAILYMALEKLEQREYPYGLEKKLRMLRQVVSDAILNDASIMVIGE